MSVARDSAPTATVEASRATLLEVLNNTSSIYWPVSAGATQIFAAA